MDGQERPIDVIKGSMEPVTAPRFLDAYLPMKAGQWVQLVLSVLLTCGLVYILMSLGVTTENLLIFAVAFYILGMALATSFPSGIQLALHAIRTRLGDIADVSYGVGPNGEKTEVSPGGATEGWLVRPPPIGAWHLDRPYDEDEGGLLADHPQNVGTPVPATLTLKSLIRIAQSALLVIIARIYLLESGDPGALYGALGVGAVILLVQFFRVRKWRALADRPTSTVRSMPMGPVEVYGQLRPRFGWPAVVFVDGDAGKCVHGLADWGWRYGHQFNWEEWVEERDEDGNVSGGRWESRSAYTLIRSASGGSPTLVHDGTGGMAVHPSLLTNGRRIQEWSQSDMSLWSTRRRPGGRVRNLRAAHAWDIDGWTVGDPFFASCYAQPRTQEELMFEQVEQSLASALPELTREGDGFGHIVTVHRGTEALVFSDMESGLSAMLPSAIMVSVALVTFLMEGMWI